MVFVVQIIYLNHFSKKMLSIDDKKVVNWSEEYHGNDWESGYMELTKINDILQTILKNYQSSKVYVKGTEKINFLKKS